MARPTITAQRLAVPGLIRAAAWAARVAAALPLNKYSENWAALPAGPILLKPVTNTLHGGSPEEVANAKHGTAIFVAGVVIITAPLSIPVLLSSTVAGVAVGIGGLGLSEYAEWSREHPNHKAALDPESADVVDLAGTFYQGAGIGRALMRPLGLLRGGLGPWIGTGGPLLLGTGLAINEYNKACEKGEFAVTKFWVGLAGGIFGGSLGGKSFNIGRGDDVRRVQAFWLWFKGDPGHLPPVPRPSVKPDYPNFGGEFDGRFMEPNSFELPTPPRVVEAPEVGPPPVPETPKVTAPAAPAAPKGLSGRTGLSYDNKHLQKHLPDTPEAAKLIKKEGAAHVFTDEATLRRVEAEILARGESTGAVRGAERYGLRFDEPIGYRIDAAGNKIPLHYGELKLDPATGKYHVIPRTGPSK